MTGISRIILPDGSDQVLVWKDVMSTITKKKRFYEEKEKRNKNTEYNLIYDIY